MSPSNQGPLRSQIYQRIDKKTTEELLEIWRTGDLEGWTGSAYDIVGEILRKRLGTIPSQGSSPTPRTRSPHVPWLLIIGIVGVLLIVAVSVFSPPLTTQRGTLTPSPISAATPTRTSASTATSSEIPEATPAAVVSGNPEDVRDGPGTEYPKNGQLNKNEEVDIIGQYRDCAWLQVSTLDKTMTGWISGDSSFVEFQIACSNIPLGTFRPSTGWILSNQISTGLGELTVDNGTERDGMVILTISDGPALAAYIRAGDSFTMKGIRDGTYYLYFSTGDKWNGNRFTTTPSYKKFEDAFEFTTGLTTYTTWSVTLHGVVGGTAAADDVDESEFPDIGN